MDIARVALQIALSLGLPVAVVWLEPRSRAVRFLSPVVVCYGLGMLLGNQPWIGFSDPVALHTCDVTVALAIPLLLFSTDLLAWLKLARGTLISFLLVMLSVILSASAAHLLLGGGNPESPAMAGMLVGVYTGGTPNMAAIGNALHVQPQTFILLNAADMLVSFGYLFFILMLAQRLLRRLAPATPGSGEGEPAAAGQRSIFRQLPPLRSLAPALGLALGLTGLIVALGLALGRLVGPDHRDALAILVITSGAVAASLVPKIRRLPGTQDAGQFLLLVFCVAMGFTTDFAELFASPTNVFGFTGLVLAGAVVIHFGLAIALRIDRDTIIITSAAGIFGPHMVGPVSVALRNRAVLFSGIASGLVGYAVANYLGLALAWAMD